MARKLMSVNDLISEQNKLRAHQYTFSLWPQQWAAYGFQNSFNWKSHPFQQNEKNNIPVHPGIYSFVIQPSIISYPDCAYLMYIGKAEHGLQHRFGQYLSEQKNPENRSKIVRLLNLYQGYLHFCCFVMKKKSDIVKIEKALICAFLPPCNDRFPAEISRIIGAFQ